MASRTGAGVVARNQLWTRLNDAVAKADTPLPTPVWDAIS